MAKQKIKSNLLMKLNGHLSLTLVEYKKMVYFRTHFLNTGFPTGHQEWNIRETRIHFQFTGQRQKGKTYFNTCGHITL